MTVHDHPRRLVAGLLRNALDDLDALEKALVDLDALLDHLLPQSGRRAPWARLMAVEQGADGLGADAGSEAVIAVPLLIAPCTPLR